MGIMGGIKGLFAGFNASRRARRAKDTGQSAPQSAAMHWLPKGKFFTKVVGESFYRAEIAAIAENTAGDSALTFFKATLTPDNNSHDPQAVAVHFGARKVAHLSREDARTFRRVLQEHGFNGRPTSCDAVVYGGGSINGKQYDYSIELDLTLDGSSAVSGHSAPTYPSPVHLSPQPAILSRREDELFIKFPFVAMDAWEACEVGSRVKPWTKSELLDIHFFAPGSIGGTGRIGVIPKNLVPELALPSPKFTNAFVHSIEGRSLVLRAA